MILGRSDVKFLWSIPKNAVKGEYRIRHRGYYKHIFGSIYPYGGSTQHFIVN